jgi:uncharacterized protein (TIGR02284 family)
VRKYFPLLVPISPQLSLPLYKTTWHGFVAVAQKQTTMQNSKETIEVLNDLMQINNDRILGYEKALKDLRPEDQDLKTLFASMITESHRIKIALATELQTLGAEIEQGTTTSGKIYRAWMDIKSVFTGHDRHGILSNCEAGEDAAQGAYQTALRHEGLPGFIRDMLTRQRQDLKGSHDEIRALRDQYA